MSFNEWLTDRGFTPESLTDTQRLALQAAWRADERAANNPPTPAPAPSIPTESTAVDEALNALLEKQRVENERVAGITALVERYLDENPGRATEIGQIGKLAVAGKWDLQKTELNLLRSCRGRAPLNLAPSTPAVTAEVIEAAVCKAAGLKNRDTAFSDRTLDASDRAFKRGLSIVQLVNMAARANGLRDADYASAPANTLRYAFRQFDMDPRRADVGPSTYDLSGILSNIANKFSREAFNYVEQVWRVISDIRTVRDFKTQTVYSLTGDLTYKKVAPGGTLEHGTLGEESYTLQADTYARLIGIDRRDLRNDDLGALAQAGRKLGRGGALKINEVFWTLFMDNGSFFTSGNGNYDTGTDTTFGSDGLTAADVLWRAMTDPDGNPMGTSARYLLVPSTLRVPALRLMNSQESYKDALDGGTNPWMSTFEVVSSVYLENTAYTGNSTKAWYMLADPADVPVVAVGFLDGVDVPTIESAEMSFDRLGIAMRGYHDFGVNFQEPRGGYKFKGEA